MSRLRCFSVMFALTTMAVCISAQSENVTNPDKQRVIAFGTALNPSDQMRESQQLAKSLSSPQSPQWRAKGDQKRAYRFPETGTDVPYRVCVPASWDGKSKLPLVMFLHGGWNDESSYLDANDKQMVKLAEQHGYLLVSPLGYHAAYGNSLLLPAVFGQPEAAEKILAARTPQRDQAQELSEKDVINVLELVLNEYPVDRSAMFLMGHSMGSGGTWYLGAKYPEYWKALAPMSGPFVQESTYPWERIRKMPIFLTEGTRAPASLEGSRQMKEWMKKNGFTIEYKEVDADHPGMVPLVLPDVFNFFDRYRPVVDEANPVSTRPVNEPMAAGKYEPTWDSLKQYECPEWFRDVKFGIWAHWGPQCQPERGDWYARQMYDENNWQGKFHRQTYGHPSKFGFKDVINAWKAEKWDPEKLVALYKRAGAQYFFAMGNHHDNFDLWDSTYQPWNSVNLGPKKNILAGWSKAAREQGLRFGVSLHAAHAWTWYETSQGSDKTGPLASVPYDGLLTKADGKGLWWEGYDPQDLYAQNHKPSRGSDNLNTIHSQWNWGNGASVPDQAYCDKFYNRTVDMINKYQPDLVYFDDTALPLHPISDAGLKIAAHLYNSSAARNQGKNQAVLFGKILSEEQRDCLTWDVERGVCNDIQRDPWQTDTCLGTWHYDIGIYERNQYKNAKTVIQMLVDIVSKNGNLLLSVPVRSDGSIDDKEVRVLEGIAAWMDVNKECIFGTRPWKVFGEGPALSETAQLTGQGFNEGRGKALTANDIRFTTKNGVLYAVAMGWPTEPLAIKALGSNAKNTEQSIAQVEVLGSQESVTWSQTPEALMIQPLKKKICDETTVFRITFK